MPQLRWNCYEFIECLEAIPTIEEYETSHHFTVSRDGLILEMTVWQYESIVQISVHRETVPTAITDFVLVIRGTAQILKGPNQAECLQFTDCVVAPSRFSYGDYDRRNLNVYDSSQVLGIPSVRLFVRPSIRIEFLREALPL